MNINPSSAPLNNVKAAPPQIDSTLEKIGKTIGDTVKENTREGTFIGDNMLLTGAGGVVGTIATGSAINKTVKAIPAVQEAVNTVFVKNGKAVGGGAALAASALLMEDAVAAYKEGNTTRAALEGTGSVVLGLGGAELIGRNYDIPVLKSALSGPAAATGKFLHNHGLGVLGAGTMAGSAYLANSGVQDIKNENYLMGAGKLVGAGVGTLGGAEIMAHNYDVGPLKGILSTPAKAVAEFAKDNAGGLGGVAITGAGAALGASGLKDIEEGKSLLGGAKLAGASIAGLGGVEMVGRTYNIPVADKALTGTAEWMKNNVKAVTGGVAMAGGIYALQDGIREFGQEDTNKWLASAKIAGGATGALGGLEMIGRNFNIPGMDRALTGPVKYIFTSKAGLVGAGGLVAASGVGAAADGVRRLTTGKGLMNDAIGAAEFTAGVAAVTGGTSLVGYATGSEKLMAVFPKNLDVIGASALLAGGAALTKHTVEDLKENGLTFKNVGKATGAGLLLTGGSQLAVGKFSQKAGEAIGERGAQGVLSLGAGAAAFKLGEKALEEGKNFLADTDDLKTGAKALGFGAGAAASGAAAVSLAENATGVELWEHADVGLGAGLIAGGGALAKNSLDDLKENGLTLKNTAKATGAAAAMTGGAHILANKAGLSGADKLFSKGYQTIGAVGLGAASYKLGEMALKEAQAFAEDPNEMSGLKAVGLGTAAAASGTGAIGLAGKAANIPILEKAAVKMFEKGGQTAASIGLGMAAYKLGDLAVDQGKQFVEKPSLKSGAAAAGLATAGVLAGSGGVAMAGKALGMPGVEKAGTFVFEKMGSGIEGTARYASKGAEKIVQSAVKHPFATLGVLAVAGAGGYYLYYQSKDSEAAQNSDVQPAAEAPQSPSLSETEAVGSGG